MNDKIKTFPRAKRFTPDDLADKGPIWHDCHSDGSDRSMKFAVHFKEPNHVFLVCLGCGVEMTLESVLEEEE